MKAHRLLSTLLLITSSGLFAACGGGGGGGYSVDLQAIGGLGATQGTYEFQVAGATETSTLTYELDGGAEQPVQNRFIQITNLQDGRHELRVLAREGTQFAEDRARWIVDNDPPAPPPVGSLDIRSINPSSAEMIVSWEAPDDGTTLTYKLHYDQGAKKKITELGGTFAPEGSSPLTITQKPVDRRYSVKLTGLVPGTWYSVALEATDGNARTTGGPVSINHSDIEDAGATYKEHSQHDQMRNGSGTTLGDSQHLADFNGNGDLDLVMVSGKQNSSGRTQVSTWTKSKRTSPTYSLRYSSSLNINNLYGTTCHDINGDGRMDLIGYSTRSSTLSTNPYLVIALGKPNYGFTYSYIGPPTASGYTTRFHYPVAGQFDGDGLADVATWVSYAKSGSPTRYEFRVYYGNGSTTSSPITSGNSKAWFDQDQGRDLLAFDLDGDGIDEIVHTPYDSTVNRYLPEVLKFSMERKGPERQRSKDGTPNVLYKNNAVAVDRDGDGDLDLLMEEYDSVTKMWSIQQWTSDSKSGLWRGGQVLALRQTVRSMLLANQDKDGIPDLILHYGTVFNNLDTIAVHHGLRDPKSGKATGGFGPEDLLSVSAVGHSPANKIVAGDMTNNGYLDFVSLHYKASARNYYFAIWESRPRSPMSSYGTVAFGGAVETQGRSGQLAAVTLRGGAHPDLVLGHGAHDVRLLPTRQRDFRRTGAFDPETKLDLASALPTGMEIESCQWADANGDGLDDLYYASKNGELGLLLATRTGTNLWYSNQILMTLSPGLRIAVDRFTADPRPDFLVLQSSGSAQVFALGFDGSRWELSPGQVTNFSSAPDLFVVADFDADGFADIAGQTHNGNSHTLESLFTFVASGSKVHEFAKASDRRLSTPLTSLDTGHFRYQSQLDVLATTTAGDVYTYSLAATSSGPGWFFGYSRRIFSGSTLGGLPLLVQAVEFTNDGYSDVAIVPKKGNAVWLYRNNPDVYSAGSSFTRSQILTVPRIPTKVMSMHLNDDRFIDLVMGSDDTGGFAFFLGNGSLR